MAPALVFPLPPHPDNQALNSKTFRVPPLDGSLVGPEIYDWLLQNSPQHHAIEYLDDDGSIKALNWKEVVRASYRAARYVRKIVGASVEEAASESERKTVIAMIGASDFVTSFILLMGIMRAGFVPFPISTRNSSAAVAHLITKTFVSHVVVGREESSREQIDGAVKILKEQNNALPEQTQFPLFEDFFSDVPESEYVPPKYAHPGFEENSLVLHSSGSTAFPKPIYWTHRAWVQLTNVPFFAERDLCGKRMACHALPIYHGMGVIQSIWAASTGLILTAFKSSSPPVTPTPDVVIREALATKSDLIMCVPSFIEAWAANPDYVQRLAKIDGLIYGGGPLNKGAGDLLAKEKVTIFNAYGTTEAGCMNTFLPTEVEDWQYFTISPHIKAAWVPYGDDLYELVMLCHDYHIPSVLNTTFDGVDGYASSDLLKPHPTKPGYWRVYGRTDDQIMHSTGEKTNPGPLESILNRDPHVTGSVMFGRGRFNAGIVVEPKPEYQFDPSDESKIAEFRNKIWPTIEQINEFAPQHSRIFKEMILIAKPSKPFTFTTKKTVRRGAVLKEYEEEINATYDAFEESAQSDISPPSVWDYDGILGYIRTIVHSVLKKEILDTDDIFERGCDSLQATWIRNSLLYSLRESAHIDVRGIPNQFVYDQPSIKLLTSYTLATVKGEDVTKPVPERLDEVNAMVKKYSADLKKHTPTQSVSPSKYVVLLTGSTGGLGSSILSKLAASSKVSRIYLLNRKARDGSTLVDRQRLALKERGYDSTILDNENVILLEGDTALANLGISDEVYHELQQTVTHIVHNAWRVDFNLSLPSFEPNVKGVRNLIDLALSSPLPTPPRILFTSSVGVYRNINYNEPIPEDAIKAEVAVGFGYGESKWVSERLLEIAAAQTTLRPVIIRVGQLSGSVNGAWNEVEWFPSIARSGPFVRCLPESAGSDIITWIPLHIAAAAMVDFLDAVSTYINLIHPRPAKWSDVVGSFSKYLNVPLVPYNEWLARLGKLVEDSPDSEVELMRQVPALKLLDFYRASALTFDKSATEAMGIPLLSVENAVKNSTTLQDPNLPMIGEEDARNWLNYWKLI